MNGSLVAIVSDEIRRFFETHPAQRAACVHVPLSRRVLRLFAQFVRHDLSKRRVGVKKIISGDGPGTNFQVIHQAFLLARGGMLDRPPHGEPCSEFPKTAQSRHPPGV
jgi:hypothetical protein